MNGERSQEVVGFLCRWCLLAAVGATILAVTWTSLLGVLGVASDLRTELVLPDFVVRPLDEANRAHWLEGQVTPPLSYPTVGLNMIVSPVQDLALAYWRERRWWVPASGLRPGSNRLLVRGLPYGPVAFQDCPLQVVCVARDRRVFLLDARLALGAQLERPRTLRECVGAMRRGGEVVLFHPGEVDRFVDCRRRLRNAGVELPILFDFRRKGPLTVLRAASGRLGRGRERTGLEVVTADAELAREAAAARFRTHLVAADAAPEGVLHHRSVAQLKESLSRRPIHP